MSHQYATLEDTLYFGFVSNDTSGSAADGTTPLFDVRLGGAAASAIPVLSGTPDLLTHANYGPGAYEVAVAATAANGFAADSTYLVFVTVTADSQTPGACLGSFTLTPLATAAALATVDSVADTILVDTADMQPKLGTPAADLAADIAAVKVDTAATLVDTAVIGAAGAGLTEAGGTGDHLTAINLPNQTMDITGNLSGSVGSVTGAVGSVTGAVGSVTGAVGSVAGNVDGNVTGSVGSLAAQAKADVNAEVDTALVTTTYAEPGQGAPAATASLKDKIGYLYKAWRNLTEQTSTTLSLYDDAGTTVDQKATHSDDLTTYTKGEVGTGP